MSPDPVSPAEALAQLADFLAQAIEISNGHREKCMAVGFSPTVAELMGVVVHDRVVNWFMDGIIKAQVS